MRLRANTVGGLFSKEFYVLIKEGNWVRRLLLSTLLLCAISSGKSAQSKNSQLRVFSESPNLPKAVPMAESRLESPFEFFKAVISSYEHAQLGISETDTIHLNEFKDLDDLRKQWMEIEYRYKVANLKLLRAVDEIKGFVQNKNSVVSKNAEFISSVFNRTIDFNKKRVTLFQGQLRAFEDHEKTDYVSFQDQLTSLASVERELWNLLSESNATIWSCLYKFPTAEGKKQGKSAIINLTTSQRGVLVKLLESSFGDSIESLKRNPDTRASALEVAAWIFHEQLSSPSLKLLHSK